MEFICGGEHYLLKPGGLMVINPGQVHRSRYGVEQSPSESLCLNFDRLALQQVLKQISFRRDPCLQNFKFHDKPDERILLQMGRDLVQELENRKIGHDALMESLAIQTLVYLLRNYLEPTQAQSDFLLPKQLPAWEMIVAIYYMERCGKKEFNLSDLCRTVGTSPSRFIPLFRNSTDLTPHIYFDHVLVQKAQQLLQTGEFSIKAASYDLGFQSLSHFCKTFRAVTGITPNSYRQLELKVDEFESRLMS